MNPPRIAYGSLHHDGAELFPKNLEGVDYLLLDGGPVVAPEQEGPEDRLLEAVQQLSPILYLNPNLKVIASLAGRRPEKVAELIAPTLTENGNAELKIGVLQGSDVFDRLEEFMAAGQLLRSSYSDQPLAEESCPVVAAALHLNAEVVQAAFVGDARLLLASMLADLAWEESSDAFQQQPTTELTILHRSGYIAIELLLLHPHGPHGHDLATKIASTWRAKLDENRLRQDDQQVSHIHEVRAENAPGTTAMIAEYHGENREQAALAHQLLLQAAREQAGNLFLPSRQLIGGLKPQYQKWPTSIPTELVEWSVDVRPAKDWVE